MAHLEGPAQHDVTTQPFAGRLGGNQEFILDCKELENASALKRVPDASPFMSVEEIFDLRGFLEPELWKAAMTECLGMILFVWITGWIGTHPTSDPVPTPSPTSGVYGTPIFLGPLTGGITNLILLSLFIFTLGPISGSHLNPMITLSTFTARLTTFPRLVLYVAFQVAGASIAGLMLRATFGSRDFLTGGCTIETDLVPTKDIFALEFMSDLTLIFLSFGVGLDPRQRGTLGPSLGPILVGFTLGVMAFGTGFSRPGYPGASMNPGRCTAVFVGSRFPQWAWVIWVAPISATIVHGVIYYALPPWAYPKINRNEASPE
jgi:glycerol uptake facilitator-like aquaporin